MKALFYFVLVINCLIVQLPATIFASENTPYDICVLSYNNDNKLVILKYHSITGQSWLYSKQGFKSLPEKSTPPVSNYKVKISSLNQKNWFATRIDTKSGKTWKLQKGMWVEYQ
jgi:hypothetical protein